LEFRGRGTACLTFGNTINDKQGIFRCEVNADEWNFDDTAVDKLTKNGNPYRPDGLYQNYSALELALQCFAGNHSLYSREESLWLSESVAELVAEIPDRK